MPVEMQASLRHTYPYPPTYPPCIAAAVVERRAVEVGPVEGDGYQ